MTPTVTKLYPDARLWFCICGSQYLTSGSPPRVYVRVAVLLQQLLLIHAEDVHAVGIERQEQIVRQVGQEVRHALHLETVEEMAPVPKRK